jgi:hypothetical protein
MTAGVSLDVDVLRHQASRVEQLGSEVAEASAAIASMNLGGGAFGVLCGFLVVPAAAAGGAARLMTDGCANLLQRAGTQLRHVVSDTEQREHDIAESLRAIERGIR